ncbi:hypothetical protein [Nocardia sp. NPDC057030]|uniref:hypothetical protein n=1 Tax=unclassified Nocardia TaxID=2637762 RepID=UPI0036346DD8
MAGIHSQVKHRARTTMAAEHDRLATQLFLRRGQFRAQDPTYATVRVDAVEREWMSALGAINYLAGMAAHLRDQSGSRTDADKHLIEDLDWCALRIERDAAAMKVPPVWTKHARRLGEHGKLLARDSLLPTPWSDHRARLVRSISADIERLTIMASACLVHSHRSSAVGGLDEFLVPDQLGKNLTAIWTRAASTADAIGASNDECERLWQVSPQRWHTVLEQQLSSDREAFDRSWSVYTDPYIAADVDSFLQNLPMYAALASPTGSPDKTGCAVPPPDPLMWLAGAHRALEHALDPSPTDPRRTHHATVEDPEQWDPQPDISYPNTNDPGPDPWA